MTNDRAATAGECRRTDDPAMDNALGEAASANGSDLDPDVRRFIRTVTAAVASHPGIERAPYPELRGGPAMQETRELPVPTRHGAVRARLHRPADSILPGLVYLHGGGWTVFSIDTHDRVMREYASRAGCCVIGVDYALSPEQKFPVALEQVVDIVGWLGRVGRGLGIDPERLAIGGGSAGGESSG